jgi:PPOX class probable F420-dependent enzyme
MGIEIGEKVAERLTSEQIIWLTTVRADGTPQPTPVWFLWTGETFLIFTQPASLKLRNIAQNPKVALNFHTDAYGGSVVVFSGEASVIEAAPPPSELDAYLAKYEAGIKMLGFTPERMAEAFSTVLRVTPTRLRAGE